MWGGVGSVVLLAGYTERRVVGTEKGLCIIFAEPRPLPLVEICRRGFL